MTWVKLVFSAIWPIIKPTLELFLTRAGIAALLAASKVVIKVQDKYGKGPDDFEMTQDEFNDLKHREAFKILAEDLMRRNLYEGASLVNMAIHAAVKWMNSEKVV